MKKMFTFYEEVHMYGISGEKKNPAVTENFQGFCVVLAAELTSAMRRRPAFFFLDHWPSGQVDIVTGWLNLSIGSWNYV